MDASDVRERGTPFWDLLTPAERSAFQEAGVVREFPAGTVIVHEGDPSDHVLVLRSGCVKVVASVADGAEFILGLRGPGDLVCELACLDGRPRRGTVSALDRVTAL